MIDYKESLVRTAKYPTFCGEQCLGEDERTIGAHRSMVRAMGHFRGSQGSQLPHCIAGCTEYHNTVCAIHSFTNLMYLFACCLHIYDVQYGEYCTGHLLSYRDGGQQEGSWFHCTQDPN